MVLLLIFQFPKTCHLVSLQPLFCTVTESELMKFIIGVFCETTVLFRARRGMHNLQPQLTYLDY